MSALADKLRGLRRQAGVSAPQPPAQRPALPDNVAALLSVRRRAQAPLPAQRNPKREPDTLPGHTIAPGLQLIEQTHAWPPMPEAFDASFARLAEVITPERLLLFDTETTGLAGAPVRAPS